jgi:hypothetical protein
MCIGSFVYSLPEVSCHNIKEMPENIEKDLDRRP